MVTPLHVAASYYKMVLHISISILELITHALKSKFRAQETFHFPRIKPTDAVALSHPLYNVTPKEIFQFLQLTQCTYTFLPYI